MRRTQLAGLLCLLLWCLPAAPAARATPTVSIPTSTGHAQAQIAVSASPSCSNDPMIGSHVETLAISATLAFLADFNALTILDVSDPARPVCRSHLLFSGSV